MGKDVTLAGESRVWIAENGAGPGQSFVYQGCMRIGDTSWPQGDITRIECPDPNRYNEFIEVAAVQGARERVSTEVMGRYPRDLSFMLELARRRCRFDMHVHVGECKNPQDFNGGWEKIKVYRDVRPTEWSDENAGALESGDQNPTNETLAASAAEIFEVTQISFAKKATAEAVREIVASAVCDEISCGDCDEPSVGCQKIFMLMVGTGATPGTLPSVLFSDDAGLTWDSADIDTLFSGETPSGVACVSGNLVVVSQDGGFHYAVIDELLAGTETWVEVDPYDGGIFPEFPVAISSADARHTWAVGTGGYIWFAEDPELDWIEQDAGVATTQDLADVHAYSADVVVAVGASNAIVYTDNGGDTWQAITGPAVGVNLTAIWVHSPTSWLVGTAAGTLFYTRNAGQTWTAISLKGSPTGIQDIQFANDTIGYMAIDTAGPLGKILRTRDGGATWYLLPEKTATGTIPANDQVNALAACKDNVNVIYGGGLADDGSGGYVVKAS
jgi:photosystem II stability/assembly factor-like uncharacterized protein